MDFLFPLFFFFPWGKLNELENGFSTVNHISQILKVEKLKFHLPKGSCNRNGFMPWIANEKESIMDIKVNISHSQSCCRCCSHEKWAHVQKQKKCQQKRCVGCNETCGIATLVAVTNPTLFSDVDVHIAAHIKSAQKTEILTGKTAC